jgi:hypothetical protein
MSSASAKFFQWMPELGFPVFLKIEAEYLESRLEKLITDSGFKLLTDDVVKKMPLQRAQARILSLVKASSRLTAEIKKGESLDQWGWESVRFQGNTKIYRLKNIGMMVINPASTLWECGIASELSTTEDLANLRVMLNRYLSWVLAAHDVFGFWGVTTQDGIVVMKQSQAFGEAVFVDVKKKLLIAAGSTKNMTGSLQISRADKPAPTLVKTMAKEELASFLLTNSTYFSYQGLPQNLHRYVHELCLSATGIWSSSQNNGAQL